MKISSLWQTLAHATTSVGRSRKQSIRRAAIQGSQRLETREVLSAFSIGGTGFDTAESMTTDDAGNLYVAGVFTGSIDLDPGVGTFIVAGGGGSNRDGYLAKYDANGAFLWGGVLLDSSINGMTTDASGTLYVTGGFQSPADFDFQSGIVSLPTGTDFGSPRVGAFVAKYSASGSLALLRQLGGAAAPNTAGIVGHRIALDSVGNIYSSGVFGNGNVDLDPGTGVTLVSNTSGNVDTYVSKLSPTGNFIWGIELSNDPTVVSTVRPSGLSVDAAQNVYVSGSFNGTVDFDPGVNNSVTRGPGSGDGFVSKLNSDGLFGYVVTFGSTSSDLASGVVVDAAGSAYVSGQFSGTTTITSASGNISPAFAVSGPTDIIAMKLTSAGELAWGHRIGGIGSDSAQAIALDGSGSVYLTGNFTDTTDLDPGVGIFSLTSASGSLNSYALRLTTNGVFVDAWSNQNSGANEMAGIDVTPTGELFVVGRFDGTGDIELGSGVTTATSAGFDVFVSSLQTGVVNLAPTANSVTFNAVEDTQFQGFLSGSDPEGQPLTYSLVSTINARGTVVITDAATGAFTYTPQANVNGFASFTFRVSDGTSFSNTATVSLQIAAVNDAPVAGNRTYSMNEDATLTVQLPGSDVDGTSVNYLLVNLSNLNGTLTPSPVAGNTFVYTPNANFNGVASFTYQVRDPSQLLSNIATIIINVNPVNDAPVAINGSLSTDEDVAATGTLLANDIDSTSLSYILDDVSSANGTVVITNAATGAFTYTPAPNFNGVASFTFRVRDFSQALSNVATVSLTVNAVNDAPSAISGTLQTNEDESAAGILSATDVDNNLLTFVLGDTSNARGSVVITNPATGAYTYTPDPNYNGPASFTFLASDGSASSLPETVSISVNSVHDAPTATDGSLLLNEDEVISGSLLANDVDNDPLTFSLVDVTNANGIVVITNASTGAYSYTPDPNFNGTASFSFVVSDGTLTSNTATVFITVNAVNDAPVATAGSLTTNEDEAATGTLSATDVDSTSLSYVLISSDDAHGTVVVAPDGIFIYTPDANYNGSASFTFSVSDGSAVSNTATVSISVTAVNDAPVVSGGLSNITVNQGAANQTISLAGVFTDVDNASLAYSAVSSNGTLAGVSVSGTDLVLTFSSTLAGTSTVSVTATDAAGLSATTSFSVTVNAVALGPGVSLANGILTVTGTAGNDWVQVDRVGSQYRVRANFISAPGAFFNISAVQGIVINVLDGHDCAHVSGYVLAPVTISGGNGNDELSGGDGPNTINGGAGHDEIEGGSANDIIDGGSGNDEIEGGAGNDLIISGTGDDEVEGDSGDDTIYAGEGNDEVEGGSGNDLLFGEAGHDELEGDSGNDVLSGGVGNDEVMGGDGRDLLIGGLGSDTLRASDSDDILAGNRVTFENDITALQLVLSEWASSRSYSSRVANLRGTGTGTRLNGSTFLNSATVLNDNAVDSLFGSSGQDWFLGTVGQDLFRDRSGNEFIN